MAVRVLTESSIGAVSTERHSWRDMQQHCTPATEEHKKPGPEGAPADDDPWYRQQLFAVFEHNWEFQICASAQRQGHLFAS